MMQVERWALRFAAVFAAAWTILRACLQSVTQDEGDTYFWFASKSLDYIWHPFPNNHVLNTALIWIATRVFGVSSFTLRLPAVLGAILYIFVCYFLCRRLTSRFSLQFPLFVCLVYNPFLLDFMAAARGYSLANAFLVAAIAVPVWHRVEGGPSLRACCAMASLALGLSFAASFSFCFADLAAFLFIVGWALASARAESVPVVAASCVFPGLAVVGAFCAYPLAHWPKGEFFYTSHSLKEMALSMVDVSLYRAPRAFAKLQRVMPTLLAPLGILCAAQAAAMWLDGSPLKHAREWWVGKFAAALAGMAAFAVLLHWIAYRMGKLPLPMTRTGTFLIPLCTLTVGAIAASPARSAVSRWIRRGMTGALVLLAGYYVLCLRFTYFKEYEDDADTKEVYAVLARLNHAYGVTDTAMDGLYVAPLNFYRILSKKESFPEFPYVSLDTFPTGKSIYVLHGGYFRQFIQAQHLAVVYRGKRSEVVVAVPSSGPIPPVAVAP